MCPGRRTGDDRGAVTLDATISVVVFMILAVFLMTLFPMFMAQHAVAHATLQAAESLSLDSYAAERLDATTLTALGSSGTSPVTMFVDKEISSWELPTGDFATLDKWYEKAGDSRADFDKRVSAQVKDRMCVYLVGRNGVPGQIAADEMLRHMYVKDGYNGMRVEASVNDAEEYLTIEVSYQFENKFFGVLNVLPFSATHSAMVRLWK